MDVKALLQSSYPTMRARSMMIPFVLIHAYTVCSVDRLSEHQNHRLSSGRCVSVCVQTKKTRWNSITAYMQWLPRIKSAQDKKSILELTQSELKHLSHTIILSSLSLRERSIRLVPPIPQAI